MPKIDFASNPIVNPTFEDLKDVFKKKLSLRVNEPDNSFVSVKNTPFVHCTRKAKEALLVFLKEGILCGMTKPVQFFLRKDIESIGFSDVSNRFFTLDIRVAGKDYEFNTIDHHEHPRIAEYVEQQIPKGKVTERNEKDDSEEDDSEEEEGDDDFAPKADDFSVIPEDFEEEEEGEGDVEDEEGKGLMEDAE